MLNKSLLVSLALLLTLDVGNYLYANDDNKIIYEKDYFNQFNITNVNDALKRIPGVENIGSRNSQSYKLVAFSHLIPPVQNIAMRFWFIRNSNIN